MLLAIWADVGEHMRRQLDGFTLADVAAMARGEAPWPEPVDDLRRPRARSRRQARSSASS